MNWKETIEAQIANERDSAVSLSLSGHSTICKQRRRAANLLQALLDVAVAAEQHVAEWDDADDNLQAALDKLREVSDERG